MMPQIQPNRYDQVPYESRPIPESHPDRLATVATLLGMKPAPVDRCRVLELGCASGGNLTPLAVQYPRSRFVGIDLSQRQIADGLKLLEALGLNNIELRHAGIQDVDAGYGQFDYIICHGVYSWVPPDVQDMILQICARNLSPQGVAFVSYNTYPGWHMRAMIRDMMCYHALNFAEPGERVQQARNLLDFMAKSVVQENNPYSLLLKSELEAISRASDSYLFHEQLSAVNDPIYFHQFAERVAARGLKYLGEAQLHGMVPANYPPEVEKTLQRISPDLIHMEQYMDFLRNRMFRHTLLCHPHVTPNYHMRPEQIQPFHVSCPAKPVSATPDIFTNQEERFRGSDGFMLNCADPIQKAALLCLAEVWPHGMFFDDLLAAARARLDIGPRRAPEVVARDAPVLGHCLLGCYLVASTYFLELRLFPPRFVHKVSEKPLAFALARVQAAKATSVTNVRHEVLLLDEVSRRLLKNLDGEHDRMALLDELLEDVARGELRVDLDGKAVQDQDKIRTIIKTSIDGALPNLAKHALLVG